MQQDFHEHRHVQLLNVKQLSTILGISPSGIWAKVKDELGFPKPFKLSANTTRWKLSAVEAFIELKAGLTH